MSKVYRVGAIGTAWAARSPLPTFRSFPGTELHAVCSARLERAKATALEFGAPVWYDDYREMLRSPEIDIVYVGSPVYLHHEMVLAAAEAGKHLLCEKPLAISSSQGREMLAAYRGKGLAHVVAFTMRNFPWSLHLKKVVADGFVGTPRHINIMHFMEAGGPPQRWTWLKEAALGGGMLGGMGSHYIDLARHFLGEFREVAGQTRIWVPEVPDEQGVAHTATAEDSFSFVASLTNGVMMSLQFSRDVVVGSGRRVEIHGSEGSIVVDNEEEIRLAKLGDQALLTFPFPAPGYSAAVAGSAVPRFGLMVEKLIESIESGQPASPNLEDALRCQEVMDAIRLSARERRTVKISEIAQAG